MTSSLEPNAASAPVANEAALFAPVGKADTIRVLLVEDDHYYRETLADELSEQGFAVHSFSDGAALLGSLDAATDADVIVLDWGLPKIPGIDLLGQLRRRGVNVPVVFLTGQGLTTHESLAFDKGAIDFICKSRGLEVLVKRLRRVVETAKAEPELRPEERLACGKLVLRPEVSRAYWDGVDLGLTLGEYNIVHLLVQAPGSYVTYRAIYDRMHHEGFIAGIGPKGFWANVRSAIKRIRNKFRDHDPTFAEIENYTGFGYCWRKPD